MNLPPPTAYELYSDELPLAFGTVEQLYRELCQKLTEYFGGVQGTVRTGVTEQIPFSKCLREIVTVTDIIEDLAFNLACARIPFMRATTDEGRKIAMQLLLKSLSGLLRGTLMYDDSEHGDFSLNLIETIDSYRSKLGLETVIATEV